MAERRGFEKHKGGYAHLRPKMRSEGYESLRDNKKPSWKKKLYIKQEYPDDYVDETFLREMQKNVDIRIYEYWTVVTESIVVTQHFSSIIIFVALFILLDRGEITEYVLLRLSFIGVVICLVIWDYLAVTYKVVNFRVFEMRILKGMVNLTMILYFLSPVLRTLTEDTSNDTIYALSVVFFMVNLTLYDYSEKKDLVIIKFPDSISINAAVLASVLLASRLSSNSSVFALLTTAMVWFALFPMFRRLLLKTSITASKWLAFVMALVGTIMFIPINKTVSLVHFVLVFVITFICPIWLIWIQRYKNNIHGPWDEARPIVYN